MAARGVASGQGCLAPTMTWPREVCTGVSAQGAPLFFSTMMLHLPWCDGYDLLPLPPL